MSKVLGDCEGRFIAGMSDKIEMNRGHSLSPFRDTNNFGLFRCALFLGESYPGSTQLNQVDHRFAKSGFDVQISAQ